MATVNASWHGTKPYSKPLSVVLGWWWQIDARPIAPAGVASFRHGTPFVTQQHSISASGIDELVVGTPLLTRDGEYIPPWRAVSANWQGAQSYEPSLDGVINVRWGDRGPRPEQYFYAQSVDQGVVPTPSFSYTQSFSAVGIDELVVPEPAFGLYVIVNATWQNAQTYGAPVHWAHGWWKAPGTPQVWVKGMRTFATGLHAFATGTNFTQFINPTGLLGSQWGDFAVQQTGVFPVGPVGLDSFRAGSAKLYNKTQVIGAKGPDTLMFGRHLLFIPQPQPAAPSGISSSMFGTQSVTHWYQYALQHSAYSGVKFGRPVLAQRDREIHVLGKDFLTTGKPTIGYHVERSFEGFDALRVGTPHVEYGGIIKHVGDRFAEFGLPIIANKSHAVVHVQHGSFTEWGNPYIVRMREYVAPFGIDSLEITESHNLINRDRTLGIYGLHSLRVPPTHLVENAARALIIPSLPATQWGDNMVAPAVRHIPLGDIDSLRMSGLSHRVYNSAHLVSFTGFDGFKSDKQGPVWSNQQTVHSQGWENDEYGAHMVARGIRHLYPHGFVSNSWNVGAPWLSLSEREIATGGVQPGDIGRHVIEGRPPLEIKPYTQLAAKYGTPRVWNVTREIMTYNPERHDAYGTHWVSHHTRLISPSGVQPIVPPKSVVAFRDRAFAFKGWVDTKFSSFHRIRNVNPDPPSDKAVSMIGFETLTIPKHRVQKNEIAPGGKAMLEFGQPKVILYGIDVRQSVASAEYGRPSFSNFTRTISPAGLAPAPLNRSEVGTPQMSPHTIYVMPNDAAPDQTRRTHRYVPDTYYSVRTTEFGRASFEHYTRSVSLRGDEHTEFSGTHLVEFKNREFRMTAGALDHIGYPVFYPHKFRLFPEETVFSEKIGDHKFTRSLDLDAFYPDGAFKEVVGDPSFENFSRNLAPQGFDSAGVGTHWMSYRDRVLDLRSRYAKVAPMTLFGSHVFGHKNRHITFTGFSSLSMKWGDIEKRMKVIKTQARDVVSPDGIESGAAFGSSSLANKTQYIYPYMIRAPKICCETEVRRV